MIKMLAFALLFTAVHPRYADSVQVRGIDDLGNASTITCARDTQDQPPVYFCGATNTDVDQAPASVVGNIYDRYTIGPRYQGWKLRGAGRADCVFDGTYQLRPLRCVVSG